MDDQPWSRATLRAWADQRSVEEIAKMIGTPSAGKSEKFWFIEPGGTQELHLDDKLKLVEEFLQEKRDIFEELAIGTSVDLFVSWSPKHGQDGISMSAALISALASAQAHVLMDTHVDCE